MLALLSLILALALLFVIVMVLHRHQQRALTDAAEREQGLPPLELDPPQDLAVPALTQAAHEETGAPEAPAALAQQEDWRSASQALKDAGEHEAALQRCRAAWPQWQSYQQAAVVIRAALKQKDLTEQTRVMWLTRLYRMACEASFLHDKVEGLPNHNWQKLTRLTSPERLSELATPWQELGYRELRLLTKTDCINMTREWGEPATHMSVKKLHQKVFTTQSGY